MNFQLPCRCSPLSMDSRLFEEKKRSLIQISRHRFSLVISGLTKVLQRVNEMMPINSSGQRTFHNNNIMERRCYESIVIVLDTLQCCLADQPKDSANRDEAMNVKLLLREICQFVGTFI